MSIFNLYIPIRNADRDTLRGTLDLLGVAGMRDRQDKRREMWRLKLADDDPSATMDEVLSDENADPKHALLAREILEAVRHERTWFVRVNKSIPHIEEFAARLASSVVIGDDDVLNLQSGEVTGNEPYIPLTLLTTVISVAQKHLEAGNASFSYVNDDQYEGVMASLVFVERGKEPVIVHDHEWFKSCHEKADAGREDEAETAAADASAPAP